MYLRRNRPATRRGVILLVVLAMLTLFAIAGITFVLYANAASESASISRDAETLGANGGGAADTDPNAAFSLFLAQFIYGVPDDATGVESALRGHSLAETMYGSWDSIGTIPSDVPFNGTGRLHEPNLFAGTDGYNMVNYTYYASDNFLRDPSRIGTRANLTAARGTYTGGQNAPYTYPDLNNMFLASVNSSTGQVVMPSCTRNWLFDPNNQGPANPNWTNAQGKYLTLRPRPADMGPGFPMPDANGLDVKNLTASPGGNDSIWIDIGAPVLSTAAGQKYKMLVAPLILDLDRCINLNVAGNIMGAGNAHASNQGWGPWEVNPSKVLNAAGAPTEWQNLFVGNATRSRYGAVGTPPNFGLPNSTFTLQGLLAAQPGSAGHVYAPADFNGLNDPGQAGAGSPTGLYNLPGAGGYSPTASFPNFPASGYGNNANGYLEVTTSGTAPPYNHAMFFNPLNARAGSGNNLFSIQTNASLLWAGVPTSPNADFPQLCPTQFSPTDPTTIRRILETTPLSMDIDRPGAAPYVYDPNNPAYGIKYTAGSNTYSYGNPGSPTLQSPFPPLASRNNPLPANNVEFDPNTWRSVLPRALTRVNLNRQLATYASTGGAQPPDRKQFAQDIFNQFLAVTGMTAVNNNIASATTAQYDTLRWLAQLSANIVDYIDTDDAMTAFQWTTSPTAPDTGWVFGTELPKLTLNEVYLQYQNDPADTFMPGSKATKPYQMNVWTELLNPLPSGADANGSNQAVLQNASGAIYQVVLTKTNPSLRATSNVLGDPDTVSQWPTPTAPDGTYKTTGGNQVLSVISSFGTAGQQVTVSPVDTTYSVPAQAGQNNGFFVLGPSDTTLTSSYQATSTTGSGMTFTVATTDTNADQLQQLAPTVLLRRLANPNLPYQANPAIVATYNPYVTVDYVDMSAVNGTVNDDRTYNSTMQVAPAPTTSKFNSYGRTQPYAGVSTLLKKQQPNPPVNNAPQTTMFRHNGVTSTAPATSDATLKAPFDWLVHLDRPLISPIELLQVSGFKPHELTQQFVFNDGTPYGASFKHIAPWQDENSRLYRFLEFAKAKNSMPGVLDGGRIPGKVNINTLDANEMEVFRALCDAQQGNTFYNAGGAPSTDSYVDQAFQAILNARTPGGTPGANDQPFWGMGLGAAAAGDPMGGQRGIAQTLLNPAFNNPAPNIAHPYQKNELLNKLFNNVTTRSNTFAVWLTVGFFQVTNDTVQPVQLGPEINFAQGRNIRHHMFAIVDRTQIVTFGNLSSSGAGAVLTTAAIPPTPTPPAPPAPTSLSLPAVYMTGGAVPDARTGRTWQLQAGMTLVYDPGVYNPVPNTPNEETVVVQGTAPNFTANFNFVHYQGANVISRGHPGPMNTLTPAYSAANDQFVVPYLTVID